MTTSWVWLLGAGLVVQPPSSRKEAPEVTPWIGWDWFSIRDSSFAIILPSLSANWNVVGVSGSGFCKASWDNLDCYRRYINKTGMKKIIEVRWHKTEGTSKNDSNHLNTVGYLRKRTWMQSNYKEMKNSYVGKQRITNRQNVDKGSQSLQRNAKWSRRDAKQLQARSDYREKRSQPYDATRKLYKMAAQRCKNDCKGRERDYKRETPNDYKGKRTTSWQSVTWLLVPVPV